MQLFNIAHQESQTGKTAIRRIAVQETYRL